MLIRKVSFVDAFIYPGTVLFILSSLFYYQVVLGFSKKQKNILKEVFIASALVVSFLTLFFNFRLFDFIPQLPNYIKTTGFSPLGGVFPNLIYLATMLPISFIGFIKTAKVEKKVYYMIASFFITMAASICAYNLLPGKQTSLVVVPPITSWSIAIDTIKKYPLFGVGPGNYLVTFSKNLPISYNALGFYSTRFPVSSSFLLNIMSEVGIIGIIIFTLIIFFAYQKSSFRYNTGAKISGCSRSLGMPENRFGPTVYSATGMCSIAQ
jgi:hypothetical protein